MKVTLVHSLTGGKWEVSGKKMDPTCGSLSIFVFVLMQQNTRSKALPFKSQDWAITCTLEANHLVIWSNGEKQI